jgi:hypothetical protein
MATYQVPDLFEYFLVVTLPLNKEPAVPEIVFHFPDKITESVVLEKIPSFCFPETKEIQKTRTNKNQERTIENFSFIITRSDGAKRYGYCRRFLSKGTNANFICFCLLSTLSSFSLFSQILDIVELKRDTEGDVAVYRLLHSVLAQAFPQPGETISVKTFSVSSDGDVKLETFRLTRSDHDYEYLEYVTFETLFSKLSVSRILKIFESLLLEQKLIVCAKSLSVLTSCVNAISVLVYPFTWQGVFVPLLPVSMIDIVAAPMPFLVGVLSSTLSLVTAQNLEPDVLIVDIDADKLFHPNQKEVMADELIFASIFHSLERTLTQAIRSGHRGQELSLLIAHTFLHFFSEIFGDYPKCLRRSLDNPDAEIQFNFRKFIKNKNTEVKRFLLSFKETQMYSCFIQEREEMANNGFLNFCPLVRVSHNQLKKKLESAKKCSRCQRKMVERGGEFLCLNCDIGSNQPKKPKINLKGALKEIWSGVLNDIKNAKERDLSLTPNATVTNVAASTREHQTSPNSNATSASYDTSESETEGDNSNDSGTKLPKAESTSVSVQQESTASSTKDTTVTTSTSDLSSTRKAKPLPNIKKKLKKWTPAILKNIVVPRKSTAEGVENTQTSSPDDTNKDSTTDTSEKNTTFLGVSRQHNVMVTVSTTSSSSSSSTAHADLKELKKMKHHSALTKTPRDRDERDELMSPLGGDDISSLRQLSSRSETPSLLTPSTTPRVKFPSKPSHKWREHFQILFNSSAYSDSVFVTTDNVEYFCYSPLLFVHLPMEKFKQTQNTTSPKKQLRLSLPIKSTVAEAILLFIHRDQITDFDKFSTQDFFDLFEFLGEDHLQMLKRVCLGQIHRSLTTKNVMEYTQRTIEKKKKSKSSRKKHAYFDDLLNICKLFFAKHQKTVFGRIPRKELESIPQWFLLDVMRLQQDIVAMDAMETHYDNCFSTDVTTPTQKFRLMSPRQQASPTEKKPKATSSKETFGPIMLQDALQILLDTQNWTDFTFYFPQIHRTLRAHKYVLAVRSAVFNALVTQSQEFQSTSFPGGFRLSRTNDIVTLVKLNQEMSIKEEIDIHDALCAFLQYVYTDTFYNVRLDFTRERFSKTKKLLCYILQLGAFFDMNNALLSTALLNVLGNRITMQNFFDIAALNSGAPPTQHVDVSSAGDISPRHSPKQFEEAITQLIQTAALLFVKSHLQEVVEHPKVVTLHPQLLAQILRLLAKENQLLKQQLKTQLASSEEDSSKSSL